MIALTLALLAQLSSQALAAPPAIEGRVIDRNGQPVRNVVIGVSPGNLQLSTDVDGRFVIAYLRDEAGERIKIKRRTRYSLDFFKPGYHVQKLDFDYVRGALAIAPIALVPDVIDVQDMGENLDPAIYAGDPTSAGAAYEGP